MVSVTKPNGTAGTSCRRDSAPGKRPAQDADSVEKKPRPADAIDAGREDPRGVKRGIGEVIMPLAPPTPPPLCSRSGSASSVRSHAIWVTRKNRVAEKAHLAQSEAAFWSNWNENRSKRPPSALPATSAAERIAAIRQKLRSVTLTFECCCMHVISQPLQDTPS